jgi:hypothetical protein
MTQQLVTANRLSDGAVVYLGPGGGWSGAIEAGLVVSDDRADALLAEAQLGVENNIVVAPYLIEIGNHRGRPVPVRLRERIRAFGPTVVDAEVQDPLAYQDAAHVSV